MSDKRKIIWIILLAFFVLSPGIGIFLDVHVLFAPRGDVLGHGIPVLTFILPVLAGGILIIAGIITAVFSHSKHHYEYIKSCRNDSDETTPVMIFHEIDLDAGRCGIRCIEVYRDGRTACLVNKDMYAPIPPAAAINARPDYTAYLISRQEFEMVWNKRSE